MYDGKEVLAPGDYGKKRKDKLPQPFNPLSLNKYENGYHSYINRLYGINKHTGGIQKLCDRKSPLGGLNIF